MTQASYVNRSFHFRVSTIPWLTGLVVNSDAMARYGDDHMGVGVGGGGVSPNVRNARRVVDCILRSYYSAFSRNRNN